MIKIDKYITHDMIDIRIYDSIYEDDGYANTLLVYVLKSTWCQIGNYVTIMEELFD